MGNDTTPQADSTDDLALRVLPGRTLDELVDFIITAEREGLPNIALLEALADLPGEPEEVELRPSQRVRPDGEVIDIHHGASLRLRVRPEAPVQVALTGHYDTVFPAAHAFQAPWREGASLRGPGTADMKGGIAVMLAALQAFEALPGDKRVGYEVLLSPDEEVGSLASAPLLAELGARARLGMTYEPALADGALVDARKGSGNFSLIVKGKAAHVGRAFADGRSAVLAAAEAAIALNALNGKRDGVTGSRVQLDRAAIDADDHARVENVHRQIVDDDMRAVLRKERRHSAPDATTRAGDNC